jgi:hypothetical protein
VTARKEEARRPRKATICEKAGCTYRSGERRCVVCGAARPLEPGDPRVRVLSLGGGLDSFAVLVRSIQLGEPPNVVVFVDVGHPGDPGEWPGTYRHVREVVAPLCARHGIRFVVIDSETYPVRDARSLFAWLQARRQIPVAGPARICTIVAKVERFEAWMDAQYPGQDVEGLDRVRGRRGEASCVRSQRGRPPRAAPPRPGCPPQPLPAHRVGPLPVPLRAARARGGSPSTPEVKLRLLPVRQPRGLADPGY